MRRAWIAVVAILLLAGCTWGQSGFDGSRTGWNRVEQSVTPGNVTSTQRLWKANVAPFANEAIASSKFLFQHHGTSLVAFALDGSTNCGGTPTTCTPAWTAPLGFGATPAFVSGDYVYVFDGTSNYLAAFDVNGVKNCLGAMCQPVWTATWPQAGATPLLVAIGAGRVYVMTNTDLVLAFDAAGQNQCTIDVPRTCTPLFTASTGTGVGGRSLSIGAGRLFVDDATGTTAVFDAAGQAGCANGMCTKLYTLAAGGPLSVTGTTAYVLDATSSSVEVLRAFDARGQINCPSVTLVCSPLWSSAPLARGFGSFPTIAGGRAFVVDQDDGIVAFDAAGIEGCSGLPRVCTPVRTIPLPAGERTVGVSASASVLFASTWDDDSASLHAYDLAGTLGCSGSPNVCAPLWTIALEGHGITSVPAVAQGKVAVTQLLTGNVEVFARP